MNRRPNALLILNDDMGFSDIGCYGGEVQTPNLNRLAENGLRFTQFYNTARCSPTRASLLTGLHPHQTGIGILVDDDGPEGYRGNLNERCVTMAEVLRAHDYRTYMSGKWHVAHDIAHQNDTWPNQRGFEHFYGILAGAANYYHPVTLTRDNVNIEHEATEQEDFYLTDAISDNAVRYIHEHVKEHPNDPFFQYVAYTSPHWPLHAFEEDIVKYQGCFNAGWDRLREERLRRMVGMGMIDPAWKLTDRDPTQPPWEEVSDKTWQARRMEVYAAQIDRMDQGIGRVLDALEETGQLENTLIFFLADNGGCAEEVQPSWADNMVSGRIARHKAKNGAPVAFGNVEGQMPGPENTYQSYGIPWANLSNTPFRLYKHWVHEGGIATPLIVHWPKGLSDKGALRHTPGQLMDIMATVLDVTGADYPKVYRDKPIPPCEGSSLAPLFQSDALERAPLFWEHEGNGAVRMGKWKLVKRYPGDWELYDLDEDRTERNDLASAQPNLVKQMAEAYQNWAERCGVIPREKILSIKHES